MLVEVLKEIVVMITVSYVNYDYCEEVAWGTGWASGLPDINTPSPRASEETDGKNFAQCELWAAAAEISGIFFVFLSDSSSCKALK